MSVLGSTFAHAKRTAWECWGEPALTKAGLYTVEDRTYGRSTIPFSPMEKRLHDNPNVDVWFGKAMMPNGKDFTWYQVWEDHSAQLRTGRKADMIFVHGTGVHGGTLASHARRYLDAGFRVIVPDLPSHGYSTGVHVYQDELRGYTAGLHAALHDVAARDDRLFNDGVRLAKRDRRECFMLGLSFGGLVSLSYGLHYPTSLREDETDEYEVPIDGLIAVGPMIDYSAVNVPIGPAWQSIIRTLQYALQLQRFEIFVPHKKCLDKDPKVYKTLVTEDKRSHQGAFRVGHLVCIYLGMMELRQRASEMKHPIFVQQGGQDRVIDFEKCFQFVRDAGSWDKRCTVYPVCQHVIYRKAKTEEEDDAGRIACIEDNVEWMCERSRSKHSMQRQMSTLSIRSDDTIVDDGVPIHPLAMAEPVRSPIGTPFTPGTPSFGSAGAFFDPSQPIPRYTASDEADDEEDDSMSTCGSAEGEEPHPLLANCHPTTLPLLAKIATQRSYRPQWKLSQQLRPYDVPV